MSRTKTATKLIKSQSKKIKVQSDDKFSIVGVQLKAAGVYHDIADDKYKIYFVISWLTKSAGFGELTVKSDSEGNVKLDTECMGKEFVMKIFKKLVESASTDCDRKELIETARSD